MPDVAGQSRALCWIEVVWTDTSIVRLTMTDESGTEFAEIELHDQNSDILRAAVKR